MTAEGDGVGVQTRTLALAWPLSQLFFFFKSPLPERLSPELLRQSSGSQDKFVLVAQNTRTGFKPTIPPVTLAHESKNTGGKKRCRDMNPSWRLQKWHELTTCCELQRVKTQTEQTQKSNSLVRTTCTDGTVSFTRKTQWHHDHNWRAKTVE